MARDGILARPRAAALSTWLVLAALLAALIATRSHAEDLATLLAVQQAFQQGREHMDQGRFEAAVQVLESQLAHIKGNREYLARLRDAYRGHVKELRLASRDAEAQVYLRRLEILDPAARQDLENPPSTARTPDAVAAPAAPAASVTPAASATPAAAQPPAATPLPAGVAVTVTPAPTGPASGYTARGIRGEEHARPQDDPFHPDNMIRAATATMPPGGPAGGPAAGPAAGPAGALLRRAEEAWVRRQYVEAGQLYEQANQADPRAAVASREQWAYCKLFAVCQQLGQSPSPASLGRLEQEVRQAMVLAPKLEAHGRDVLGRIQEGRGTSAPTAARTAEVRHVDRAAGGWALAETAHFRVYHTQGRDFAEHVAQAAERTFRDVNRKWFNDDGEPWSARCEVFLYPTAQDYSRATGKPTSWPAHSTIASEGGRVVTRRIDLHAEDHDLMTSSLPHEATHVVLAGRFGGADLPRWADEGMAVLTEPSDKVANHLRTLPRHSQDGLLFSVRDLLTLESYPEPRRLGAFYAQSVSLTQYLVNLGGPPAFTRFLQQAMRYGPATAVQRTYGCDLATLEQRWRQAALGGTQAALGR